jgi:hypothetical protein
MRIASTVGLLAISLLPSVARADETESVKIGRLEEIGVVVAGVGATALVSGGILMAMGFDRRLAPGQTADEVYIGTAILISGAVLLGAGIPIAFIGKAKRHEREKKQQEQQKKAMIVPTFGGAALAITF